MFRSAFFRKEHTVLFSPKHSTFSRFAASLLRTDPPSVRRCSAGLIGSAKRSDFSRSAASGGRGELRSPLRPPLLPPAFCRFVVQKDKSVSDRQMNRPPFVRQYGILLTNGVLFMPKGVPNKRYTGEFKQEVVETMQREKLSYKEVARLYGITAHDRVASWERIYLEEGPEGLYIERRGRGSKGSPPKKLKPEVEEDLLAEVQRLRAENAYLKKLNALVAERVRQERKQK